MKHQPWLPLARDLLLQQTAQSPHEQHHADRMIKARPAA